MYDRPHPLEWLMGLATRDSRDELSCTSVYAFKEWLRAELMRIGR